MLDKYLASIFMLTVLAIAFGNALMGIMLMIAAMEVPIP